MELGIISIELFGLDELFEGEAEGEKRREEGSGSRKGTGKKL